MAERKTPKASQRVKRVISVWGELASAKLCRAQQGLPPWPQLSRALRGRAKRTPINLSNPTLRNRPPSLLPPPLPALAARGSQHASHPSPPGDSALGRRCRRRVAVAAQRPRAARQVARERSVVFVRRGGVAQRKAPLRRDRAPASLRSAASAADRPCTVSLIAVAWRRMERDADLPIADDTPMCGGGSGAPT